MIEILMMGWKVSGGQIGCIESGCTFVARCPINGQIVMASSHRKDFQKLHGHSQRNSISHVAHVEVPSRYTQ